MDRVDRKNDRCAVYLDRLYCPATDLTRAGKPDWCRTTPRCVAKHTCLTREGARDVPRPSFVVYPQPPEMDMEAGYSTTQGEELLDQPSETGDLTPPAPGSNYGPASY